MFLFLRDGRVANVAAQDWFVGKERCLLSVLQIERACALQSCVQEEPFVIGEHSRAAVAFSACVDFKVLQLSRRAVQHGGNRTTARHDEILLSCHHRSLWSHPGKRRRAVRLLDVLRAGAVVDPNDVAGFCIQ